MGCRAKNVFSGELAVPRKCNNTPAQLASTSFTGGKLTLFCFRRWCIKQPGTGQPQDPPKKTNHKKKTQKIHCPLLNLGLSNELLHVVLASLCILSPSAQFCFRAIKQRRNLQLTIFRFRRWCIKQPGTGQPQDPKKKKIRERLFLGHGRNSSSREKKKKTYDASGHGRNSSLLSP